MTQYTASLLLASVLLSPVIPGGSARAQEPTRPSMLIPPWAGSSAPNLAADITVQIRAGVDALDRFDLADWDALVDSLRATRPLPDPIEAECIVGRQLGFLIGADYVLCGGVGPTADGLLMQLGLYDLAGEREIRLTPIVSNDRARLVEHAVGQVRAWSGGRR